MMMQEKIDRINELARKAKEEGLTDDELVERDILRKEYIAAFRANLKAQLDSIRFVEDEISELEDEVSEIETIIEINPNELS